MFRHMALSSHMGLNRIGLYQNIWSDDVWSEAACCPVDSSPPGPTNTEQ